MTLDVDINIKSQIDKQIKSSLTLLAGTRIAQTPPLAKTNHPSRQNPYIEYICFYLKSLEH